MRNSHSAKPEDAYHHIKMTIKYYTYYLNFGMSLPHCTFVPAVETYFSLGVMNISYFLSGLKKLFQIKRTSL